MAGAPMACGALGDYDRERVRAIAAGLGERMRAVHDDERSILYCDRDPIRWGGERERGYAWVEGDLWRGDPASWEEASRLGACGLALDGRRRVVHSSVSGYARLYWIEDRGATYFASRVDPLVGAWPRSLSVDWDAWAATIILRHPVGGRTPFAEIRRLGPHAALRRRLGRSRVERPAWPWAEIEPRLSLAAGADAWVAALRETLASLEGELLCPLSGGRDSRIVLCARSRRPRGDRDHRRRRRGRALRGGLRRAGRAASSGSRTRSFAGAPRTIRSTGTSARGGSSTSSSTTPGWSRSRIGSPAPRAPVLDGGAIDVTFQAGDRFYTAASLDTSHPRAASEALFETVRRYGHAHLALADSLRAPLLARAREQYHGRDEALRGPSVPGHPRRLLDPHASRDLELSDRAARPRRRG